MGHIQVGVCHAGVGLRGVSCRGGVGHVGVVWGVSCRGGWGGWGGSCRGWVGHVWGGVGWECVMQGGVGWVM